MSSRILKDTNGDINEHLRNHIHLTNCIHLKNHMHHNNNNNNKQSPVLTDRSLLMKDLISLQRSTSLKDPSATPNSKDSIHKDVRTRSSSRRRSIDRNVVVKKNSNLRLSNSSPMVNFGSCKVTPSDEKLDGSSRKSYRVEVYSPVKTLSDQLNEVLGYSDDLGSSNIRPRGNNGRRRRKRRAVRRGGDNNVRDNVVVGVNDNKSDVMSIASNNVPRDEEGGGRSCGMPFNWSGIHSRGKTFLDVAGRSLSCGMSDSKGKKGETDVPMMSDYSSSPYREALPLLVDSTTDNERWVHDYSGELGIYADDLLKNNKGSDFSEKRSTQRHQSFTQKYTPRTFRDLVGQSLAVQALSNAVAKRRIGLLYVFHGPNGTGKTSCARIFARALNCHSTEHSKPCGRCGSCVSYDNGKNRNIREMGPAKSFDFERLLDKKVGSSQEQLVFIFDDCDSMSMESWNSLSKIVDRAPRRVVFVLVCSNLDVLPHVVVSRCQKFFFPKIKDADIVRSLQRIASKEDIDIENDALKLVALKSDGSLRDAEMTLEQLSLLGTRISVPLVQEMVGLVSDEKLVDLLDLALSADTTNTVKNLRIIMETGVEPLALMSQLATVITDILAGSYDFSKDQCQRNFFRRQQLSKEDMEKLRQALTTLSESEKQLRVSNDKLTWLTAALLQLAPDKHYSLPPNRPSVEEIWLEVIEKVRITGLRDFLYKEGKIFAISIGACPTVVVMFDSPLAKATAESYEDHIVEAFEAVLGSPVTLEMRTEPKDDARNHVVRFRGSEIVELGDEYESGLSRVRRKHLEASQRQNNQSIVRGKVSLAQVIKQAEGSGWSKRKAEKLEHENLRLEPKSRSLICWKASRSTRRKLSRLKVRTRRLRSQSLLKLLLCGKRLPTSSPPTR